MSIYTLFGANAMVALVTAFAFLAAWRSQKDRAYWPSWVAANATLVGALLFLMHTPAARSGVAVTTAHCLLVAGFGMRWQAARQFGGRPASLMVTLGATLLVALLFATPGLFSHGSTFAGVNLVLAALSLATGFEFWRDRQDRMPSRYGLVLAYWLMGASFAARIGQGLFLNDALENYLPQDLMLQIHLLVALFYTTGSSTFILSLAYERESADLQRMALTDSLTGLNNRRAFEADVAKRLNEGGGSFALVLFDIDHFKTINDRYGHAAGDMALRACADICRRTLRQSDFIARIGGEEFAAILPDSSAHQAHEITDRIRRAIEAHEVVTPPGQHFRLTLSAGIVVGTAASFDELMRKADTGLYRAKNAGRNRIEQVVEQAAA